MAGRAGGGAGGGKSAVGMYSCGDGGGAKYFFSEPVCPPSCDRCENRGNPTDPHYRVVLPQYLVPITETDLNTPVRRVPFVQMASQTEKMIFALLLRFVADTDTEEISMEVIFLSRCRCSYSLQL